MIDLERIAPAYLLVCSDIEKGEEEVIKIAKVIQCENKSGCGECVDCTQVESRIHPDLRFIRPDGISIKRDQILEVLEDSYIKPYSGNMKIFVLCGAENMPNEAANLILKTLEEPPGKSVFFLITSNPYAVLPTIQSRCQRITIENTGFIDSGVDEIEQKQIINLIEDSTTDEIDKLFSNAKKLAKNKGESLDSLESAIMWYRENRNFKMVELIEETKKLIIKNVNPELAIDVLLLRREI